jgi:hypothetical protein
VRGRQQGYAPVVSLNISLLSSSHLAHSRFDHKGALYGWRKRQMESEVSALGLPGDQRDEN